MENRQPLQSLLGFLTDSSTQSMSRASGTRALFMFFSSILVCYWLLQRTAAGPCVSNLEPIDEQFYIACSLGELDKVKNILRLHPYLATLIGGHSHAPGLHYATERGHVAVVRYLLGEGADIHAQDRQRKETALHRAARTGRLEVVRVLLARGARVDAHDGTPQKNTALIFASHAGHLRTVEYLVYFGASVHMHNFLESPLHSAIRRGHRRIAAFLVRAGADVHAYNRAGDQPIHLAAQSGYLDIVEFLARKGAKLGALTRNIFCDTALHLAAEEGHLNVVRYLIRSGAAVESLNIEKETPLHGAVEENKLEIVRFLLAHGAEIDPENSSKETPLAKALKRENVDTAEFLIARGHRIDSRIQQAIDIMHENPRIVLDRRLDSQQAQRDARLVRRKIFDAMRLGQERIPAPIKGIIFDYIYTPVESREVHALTR